jgi:hypothetical protein
MRHSRCAAKTACRYTHFPAQQRIRPSEKYLWQKTRLRLNRAFRLGVYYANALFIKRNNLIRPVPGRWFVYVYTEPRDFYISLGEKEAFNYWHIERAAVLHFGRVIFISAQRERAVQQQHYRSDAIARLRQQTNSRRGFSSQSGRQRETGVRLVTHTGTRRRRSTLELARLNDHAAASRRVQHSLRAHFSQTRPIKDANTRSHYFIHRQIIYGAAHCWFVFELLKIFHRCNENSKPKYAFEIGYNLKKWAQRASF